MDGIWYKAIEKGPNINLEENEKVTRKRFRTKCLWAKAYQMTYNKDIMHKTIGVQNDRENSSNSLVLHFAYSSRDSKIQANKRIISHNVCQGTKQAKKQKKY